MARPDFLSTVPHPRAVTPLRVDLDGFRRAKVRGDAQSRHSRGADEGSHGAADAEGVGGPFVSPSVLGDTGGGESVLDCVCGALVREIHERGGGSNVSEAKRRGGEGGELGEGFAVTKREGGVSFARLA